MNADGGAGAIPSPLFRSTFIGGFECSCQRLRDGRRLDQLAATAHDRWAAEDYARLQSVGIRSAREGLRWHRIETSPGRYEFSSVLPQLRAARAAGVQIAWDLCHFGWPDDLDPFAPAFVARLANLARAFARLLVAESGEPPYLCPINEISFVAWVGGEAAEINPYCEHRGFELKCNLVRASIAAIEAVREVAPNARFFANEPSFHVIAARPEDAEAAEHYRQYQFQAWDLLAGRLWPQLGGAEHYLDVIGLNYYPWNQWHYDGPLHAGACIAPEHPQWKSLADMLVENHARYGRPVFIAETGCENERRAPWLARVCGEVREALQRGVPVQGICLYPIVNFPGWADGRHCHNGLWDYADAEGGRACHEPLAAELQRQQRLMREAFSPAVPGPARASAAG